MTLQREAERAKKEKERKQIAVVYSAVLLVIVFFVILAFLKRPREPKAQLAQPTVAPISPAAVPLVQPAVAPDYSPFRQYEAALRELSISTTIGATEPEFRKRLTDCTVRVDALRGKFAETARRVPAKDRDAFSEVAEHLDRSLGAYTASLTYWKPPEGYYYYGTEDDYRKLTTALPGFRVTPTYNEYARKIGSREDFYDKGEILQALWDYAGKELARAGQSLDALESIK